MRIESVEITGLGPFLNRTTVTFPTQGVSLVVGPNESGKSILMQAVTGVIFGMPHDVVERLRSGPEPEGRVRVSLADGHIEFVRFFNTDRVEMWDVSAAERRIIYSGEATEDELSMLMGFSDPAIAEGTTFVAHGDMATRPGERLRQVLVQSKRSDYEKILAELRAEYAGLTRVDPWSGVELPAPGEVERLEADLSAAVEARLSSERAVRIAMQLEEEAQNLEEQLADLQARTEEEARTLEALAVLEGLQGEERALRQGVSEVEVTEETVRNLQNDVTSTTERVNREHGPLLPLALAFLQDLDDLEERRRELDRVVREVEVVNAHRAELQAQVRRLTEDYTSLYGAFDGLPLDFPQRLLLYPGREKELSTIQAELEKLDGKIAALQAEIDEKFPRFKRFDDGYGDELRDLGVRETFWKQQLLDLETEQQQCRETADEITRAEHRLNTEYKPYLGVAKDFRTRLRNWHRIWLELQARTGPVRKAQEEIGDIQTALSRYDKGQLDSYFEALRRRDDLELELDRLTQEKEALAQLSEERTALQHRIDTEHPNLKGKVKEDFPDKLREHLTLRDEYVRKSAFLDEARARLKDADDRIHTQFARFLDKDAIWGEQLEAHHRHVEEVASAVERLGEESGQVDELQAELERLRAEAAEEAAMFEPHGDAFPDLMREYGRLRGDTQNRDRDDEELRALGYGEFINVSDDFARKTLTYRTHRNTLNNLSQQIAAARETVARHERRLVAMDIVLSEDYSHFKDVASDIDKSFSALARVAAKKRELRAELEVTNARYQEMAEEKSRDKGLGALLGFSGQRAKDLSMQESRVQALEAQIAELDREEQALRQKLGPLAERENTEGLQDEFAHYRKLMSERAVIAAQIESAESHLKTLQADGAELEEKLARGRLDLGYSNDTDVAAMLTRYQEYESHRARLFESRSRAEQRVAELEVALESCRGRLDGEAATNDDIVEGFIERFKDWKKRQERVDSLKARIANLPGQTDLDAQRASLRAELRQAAEGLGLEADEPVARVLEQWQAYEVLQRQVSAEESVIESYEEELRRDGDGQGRNRLEVLSARLSELAVDLGVLAAHPDMEELIADCHAYLGLQARVRELDAHMAGLPTADDLERQVKELKTERRAINTLGLPADAKPDLDNPEDAWQRWKKTLERLEARLAALTRQLDMEQRDGQEITVLERLQKRLDELAPGLGGFTEVTDLDLTLKRYDEYLALTVRLESLRKTLEVLPPAEELDLAHQQVEVEMVEARDKLGLAPNETCEQVGRLWESYAHLVRKIRNEEDARNRVLVKLSVGNRAGRTTHEVLTELKKNLEELRASLGGFEEAGEEAEEVIAQFRDSQELKHEIESLQGTIDALRSIQELEEWSEATREPVVALESKLAPAGDVHDVDSLRDRYRAYQALQDHIQDTLAIIDSHPTLAALAETKRGLHASIDHVLGRVRALFNDCPNLEKWHHDYLDNQDELRPSLTASLARMRQNCTATGLAIDQTWSNLREHNERTADVRVNMAGLDAQIRQLRREVARATSKRDGLRAGIDLLNSLVDDTPQHLSASVQIRARDILRDLTGGRYDELEVDGPHFEPSTCNPQGVVLRGEQVRGGLHDQLYFAVRAALAQELRGNIRLPFLIDDPFSHLDTERLDHARACLKTLAQRYQIILFTHDDRLRTWGPVVLDLGRLPSPDGPAPATPSLVTSS